MFPSNNNNNNKESRTYSPAPSSRRAATAEYLKTLSPHQMGARRLRSPARDFDNLINTPTTTTSPGTTPSLPTAVAFTTQEPLGGGVASCQAMCDTTEVRSVTLANSKLWAAERAGCVTVRDPSTGVIEAGVEFPLPDSRAFCWCVAHVNGLKEGDDNDNNDTVWAGWSNGYITVHSAADSQTLIGTLHHHKGGVNALCPATTDTAYVYSGSADFTIVQWDRRVLTPVRHIQGHRGGVRALCRVGSTMLVSASDDATMKIWDCDPTSHSGVREVRTLTGHTGSVLSIAHHARSPHGRLWSTGEDGSVRVSCVATGKQQVVPGPHSGRVTCVRILGTSRAVTAGVDSLLVVYDAERCNVLSTVRNHHTGYILCLSPPMRRTICQLWTCSNDRTMRLWRVDLGLSTDGAEPFTGEDSDALHEEEIGMLRLRLEDARATIEQSDVAARQREDRRQCEYESKLENSLSLLRDARAVIEAHQSDADTYKAQCDDARRENDRLRDENASMSEVLDAQTDELIRLREAHQRLQSMHQTYVTEHEASSGVLKEQLRMLEVSDRGRSEVVVKLMSELAEANDATDRLRSELSHMEAERDALTRDVKSLAMENEKLADAVETAQSESKQFEHERQSLLEALNVVRADADAKALDYTEMNKSMKLVQSDLAKANQNVETLALELAKCQDHMQQHVGALTDLEADHTGALEELDVTRGALNSSRGNVQELELTLGKERELRRAAESAVTGDMAELRVTIRDLEHKLHLAEKEKDDLYLVISGSGSHALKLELEAHSHKQRQGEVEADYQRVVDDLNSTQARFEEECASLTSDVRRAEQTIRQLEHDLAAAKRALNVAEEEKAKEMDMFDHTRSECASLRRENEQLRGCLESHERELLLTLQDNDEARKLLVDATDMKEAEVLQHRARALELERELKDTNRRLKERDHEIEELKKTTSPSMMSPPRTPITHCLSSISPIEADVTNRIHELEEVIDVMRLEIDRLQDKITSQQRTYVDVSTERDSLQRKLQGLEYEIEATEIAHSEELEYAALRADKAAAESATWRNKADTLEHSLRNPSFSSLAGSPSEDLEAALMSLRSEVDSKERMLSSARAELGAVREKELETAHVTNESVTSLQKSVRELREKLHEATTGNRELSVNLESSQKQLKESEEQRRRDLDANTREAERLRAELEDCRLKLRVQNHVAGKQETRADAEQKDSTKLKEHNRILTHELRSSSALCNELTGEITRLRSELTLNKEIVANLEADKELFEGALTAAGQQRDALLQSLEEAEKNAHVAQDELSELRLHLALNGGGDASASPPQSPNTERKQLFRLRAELEEEKRNAARLSGELQQYRKRLLTFDAYTAPPARDTSMTLSLERSLSGIAQEQVVGIARERDLAMAQLTQQKALVSSLQSELDDVQAALEARDMTILSLKNEERGLKTKLRDCATEKEDAMARADRASEALRQVRDESDQHGIRLAQREEELADVRRKLSERTNELQELKAKDTVAQRQLADLHEETTFSMFQTEQELHDLRELVPELRRQLDVATGDAEREAELRQSAKKVLRREEERCEALHNELVVVRAQLEEERHRFGDKISVLQADHERDHEAQEEEKAALAAKIESLLSMRAKIMDLGRELHRNLEEVIARSSSDMATTRKDYESKISDLETAFFNLQLSSEHDKSALQKALAHANVEREDLTKRLQAALLQRSQNDHDHDDDDDDDDKKSHHLVISDATSTLESVIALLRDLQEERVDKKKDHDDDNDDVDGATRDRLVNAVWEVFTEVCEARKHLRVVVMGANNNNNKKNNNNDGSVSEECRQQLDRIHDLTREIVVRNFTEQEREALGADAVVGPIAAASRTPPPRVDSSQNTDEEALGDVVVVDFTHLHKKDGITLEVPSFSFDPKEALAKAIAMLLELRGRLTSSSPPVVNTNVNEEEGEKTEKTTSTSTTTAAATTMRRRTVSLGNNNKPSLGGGLARRVPSRRNSTASASSSSLIAPITTNTTSERRLAPPPASVGKTPSSRRSSIASNVSAVSKS